MSISAKQIIERESVEILMQLVISPNTDYACGIEALARGMDYEDGSVIPPTVLFKKAKDENLIIELEKLLVRKSLEVFQSIYRDNPHMLLFINLTDIFMDKCLTDDFLVTITEEYGIAFKNIVYDINQFLPEYLETGRLFIEKYRPKGFLMCIDDIGVNYNNVDKILYLNPDMIKVNIAAVRKMENAFYRNNMMKFLKLIADQLGILLVAKGIEINEDVQTTIENGTQFMQGYFISKPVKLESSLLNEIITQYRTVMLEYYRGGNEEIETNRKIITRAITLGVSVRDAIVQTGLDVVRSDPGKFLSKYPLVENIWVLNKEGIQQDGTIINTSKYNIRSSPIFQIYNAGADFSSRELYRQLMDTILDVWVTRPYRSILTNNLCIGCSVFLDVEKQDTVVCVNINYDELLHAVNDQ